MITKVSSNRVLKAFFENPEKKFHLRELARHTGLSIAGVIKIVKELKAAGLLKSKKERTVELVEANFDKKFLYFKRAHNLLSLYECGLVQQLNEFYEQPQCVIVFGSYADGTDLSNSDIDIVVVTKIERLPNLSRLEKTLKRKINILTIDLDKAKPSFKNSLANGIVLVGYLEVIK